MNLLLRKTERPDSAGYLFQPPEWRWAQTGDVGWWIRADWQHALLGPDGLRLDEWARLGRLTVIKTHAYRVVYRAELDEGAVYVKHYLVPGIRAKIRQWLRRGKGRNEGQRTRYLNTLGVPTITPVALGEQRKRTLLFENYLITHAIPETVSLDIFLERRLPDWPEDRQASVRRNLATSLAVMTARLHDAGFYHLDFHPGNILVQVGEDDEPRLAIIDLDGLRVTRSFWQFWEDFARLLKIHFDARSLSKPLTWPESRRNLALLNHYFWLRSERSDRYRFLRTYLQAREAPAPPPVLEFARGIEDATREWAERLWRRWGKRCQKSNKYFTTASGPRTWSVASRELDSATLRDLLQDPDAPFRQEGTILLKHSRTTTVAETTMIVGGQPTRVIYKRFNKKKWIDPFLTYFRPSRAWQAWQAAQHLASRAIPTPRNLAFIARLREFPRDLFWYLPHETYLVTVKEENAVDLINYVRNTLAALDPEGRRARINRLNLALARLLRTLHERSLSHRDLKAANILVQGDPSTSDFRLSLIDLVGVRLMHPLPRHRQVQNLARLHVSLANVPGRTRTDALRFLRAYLEWGLSPRNDWKQLWRDVDASGDSKRNRNMRRGRVLS